MKTQLFNLMILAFFCAYLMDTAQGNSSTGKQTQQQVLSNPVITSYGWGGMRYRIKFSSPMISLEQTGSNVEEGFLSLTPKAEFEAKWIAMDVMEVRLSQKPEFRSLVTLTVKKGTKDLEGRPVPAKIGEIKGPQHVSLRLAHTYPYKSTRLPHIILVERNNVSLDSSTMGKSWFQEKNGTGKIAAKVRQMTVGDAEKSSGRIWELQSRIGELPEDVRKNPETVLKDIVWLVPEKPLSRDKEWQLIVDYPGKIKEKNPLFRMTLPAIKSFDVTMTCNPSEKIWVEKEKQYARYLHVNFNFSPEGENLPDLFRNEMIFILDGVTARSVEGEYKKTAIVKGEEISLEIPKSFLERQEKTHGKDENSLPVMIYGKGVFECKLELGKVNAIDGQTLPEEKRTLAVPIKAPTPTLEIDAGMNGIMRKGNKIVRFATSNLESIDVFIKKLDPRFSIRSLSAYENYYIGRNNNETASSLSGMHFVPFDMLQEEESVVRKTLPVSNEKYLKTSLDELYGSQVKPGLYFFEVKGKAVPEVAEGMRRFGIKRSGRTDSFHENDAFYGAQMILQVTDIGLMWKTSGGKLFAYAYSLATGKPLDSGKVNITDDAGKITGSGDVSGGTCQVDITDSSQYLTISSGEDAYVTRISRSQDKVDLWNFPVSTRPWYWEGLDKSHTEVPERMVYLFTDRSIYRPGETVHLKGIFRNLKNNTLSVADEPAYLTWENPSGTVIRTQKIEFSEFGTFDFSSTLPEDEVGRYHVTLYFPRDGKATSHHEDTPLQRDEYGNEHYYLSEWEKQNRQFGISIPVQEFKRNEFEVKSHLEGDILPAQKKLLVSTTARNYSGIPVAEGKAQWLLSVSHSNFYPPDFKEFSFGDYRKDDPGYWLHYYGYDTYESGDSGRVVTSRNGTLDNQGEGRMELTVPEGDFPRLKNITVTTQVTNSNEQSLSTSLTTQIHPASLYVGIGRNVNITKGAGTWMLDLVAVDTDGNPVERQVDVLVKVTRRTFDSVRYGSYRSTTVRNEPSEKVVLEDNVSIKSEGSSEKNITSIPVEMAGPGIYIVEVSGTDPEGNTFKSAERLWIYSESYTPWEYLEGMKLVLVSDKKVYNSGETAKILLQTPIDGEVLVTVERDSVLRSFLKKVTLDDPIVEVPILEKDIPEVAVSVFLVKGAEDSNREFKDPQFKLGYCSLKINPEKYRLNIDLDVPRESVLPGKEMTVSGKVTDSQGNPAQDVEIVLFAEDEGTLDVMGYKTPKPLSFFYANRYLGTRTYQTLSHILSENMSKRSFDNKGIFIGDGGDEYSEQNASIGEDARRNFNPCAIWLASLKTDENGAFTVKYNNPDTFTRYRLMAIAADKSESFGSSDTPYVVNKPVMLEPGMPQFASLGDELVIPVTVSRTTRRDGKWKVEFHGNDKVECTDPSRIITIPDSGSISVPFTVKFTDLGDSTLGWKIYPVDDVAENRISDATHASLTDFVEHSCEVIFPAPLLRETHMVTFSPGKRVVLEDLLSPELKTAEFDFKVKISDSPIIFANDSLTFLLNYPYGCLEQTSSTTMPWLFADTLSNVLSGFPVYSEQQRKEMIQAAAEKILRHLQSDGSLAYWIGDSSTGEYANRYTPYGALTLLMCRENGAIIPDKPVKAVLDYLNKWTEEKNGRVNEYAAAWVLSRGKALSGSRLNILIDKEAKFDQDKNSTESVDRVCRLYLALAILESDRSDAKEKALALISRKPVSKKNTSKGYYSVLLSNTGPLELMIRTKINPLADDTTKCLHQLLNGKVDAYRQFGNRSNTTWTNGWDTMALGTYLQAMESRQNEVAPVLVLEDGEGKRDIPLPGNGKTLDMSVKKSSEAAFSVPEGGPVAYGIISCEARPKQVEYEGTADKGFVISREYETLDQEGKWNKSTSFSVGDIIRVTMKAQKKEGTVYYAAIEDYLPSAFEAINPNLVSQNGSLKSRTPEYSLNDWVNHCEFRKDRVRFFANVWEGSPVFKATYLVRVVKAGQATAPPAKAELMYEPQVYGLSSSMRFEISSRSDQ